MGWLKNFLGFISVIVIISFLVIYWFFPYGEVNFSFEPQNSNFSLINSENDMQFYSNMRFPEKEISYKIDNCPIKKKEDVIWAFNILENETILKFYQINEKEEISVICEDTQKFEGSTFIAGEGGPVDIIKSGKFNIILNGKILLLEASECEKPNIALHEILHVLGFNHSSNPNNIMYYLSKCRQTIGEDTIKKINELYSVPSNPDLGFENVSAVMHGKYLDINVSVRNYGLKDSENYIITIYADDKNVKEMELDKLKLGYKTVISLSNLWVSQISVNEIKLIINSSDEELNKKNNIILLKIKNKN